MRVRTFTGFRPLDIESGINHWLDVCTDVKVLKIHYQEGNDTDGRRVSALVEFVIVLPGEYTK